MQLNAGLRVCGAQTESIGTICHCFFWFFLKSVFYVYKDLVPSIKAKQETRTRAAHHGLLQ